MFKKAEIVILQKEIEILQERVKTLEQEKNLILDHLKIRIWESPPVPRKKEIISSEEYQKKMDAQEGSLGQLSAMQNIKRVGDLNL